MIFCIICYYKVIKSVFLFFIELRLSFVEMNKVKGVINKVRCKILFIYICI